MEPVVETVVEVIEQASEPVVEVTLVVEPVAEVAPVVEQVVEVIEQVAEVAQVVEQVVEVTQMVEQVTEVTQVVEQVTEQVAEVAQVVEQVAEVVLVVAQVTEVVEQVTEVVPIVVEQVVKPVLHLVIEPLVEASHEIEQAIELTRIVIEEANSLTPIQKEALDLVFNDVKSTVEHILVDADVPIQIKLMQMISPIIKTVQDISALKLALTGADKKAVALECGRKCIKMILKDHHDMLMLYTTIAEPALETMIDLSRKLKPIQEQLKEQPSVECCLGLFSACMSLKSK